MSITVTVLTKLFLLFTLSKKAECQRNLHFILIFLLFGEQIKSLPVRCMRLLDVLMAGLEH